MNPPKNKVWDSAPESRPCFAGDSQEGKAMHAMLTVALMAACMINVACVFGHL
jgi:hypothetical protein